MKMSIPPAADQKIPLSVVSCQNLPIYEQLQLEEALLRADDRNWCLINTGSPPAIVMGISGKPQSLIHTETLRAKPVPVIRRFSGGGTVFIDTNTLFVTWICNAQPFGVPCCSQKISLWTESFYQKALPSLGLELMENDYIIGERKVGGNAQYLCRGRWLHHSSLLWDYEKSNMSYLLMPPKMPSYREGRVHEDFMGRLKNHFKERHELQNSLNRKLQEAFEITFVELEDILEVKKRPHRQATQYVDIH